MVAIQLQPNLNKVAAFIARMNQLPEHHIGYCGTDPEEILHTMEEDFTDVAAKDAFVTVIENDEIVGVCGFDADVERGTAEIWGPIIDHHDEPYVTDSLWDALIEKVPDVVHTVSLFPGQGNGLVLQFATKLEFRSVSEETILTCIRENLKEINSDAIITLPDHKHDSLVALHDHIFPKAYLTGSEMLEGRNEQSTILAATDKNGMLQGYLYAEADPEFGEGSVEFFGVDPSARGEGLGSVVLAKGVQWLFSFEAIGEISLCVSSGNEKAIHLYKKIGFEVEHELIFFEKGI